MRFKRNSRKNWGPEDHVQAFSVDLIRTIAPGVYVDGNYFAGGDLTPFKTSTDAQTSTPMPGKGYKRPHLGQIFNKAKALGFHKGAPDLRIMAARHRYGFLCMELKANPGTAFYKRPPYDIRITTGRAFADMGKGERHLIRQVECLDMINRNGGLGIFVEGMEQAQCLIQWYFGKHQVTPPIEQCHFYCDPKLQLDIFCNSSDNKLLFYKVKP